MSFYSYTIIPKLRQFNVIVILLGVALFLFAWGDLTKTFFQQDEWFGFGKALYAREYGILSILKPTGFHFFPLTTAFFVTFFNQFGLRYELYAYFSLFLQIINAIIVYHIVRLIADKTAATISFIIFLLFFLSHQAFSWYAASLSLLPGATCALLAIYLYLIFIKKQKNLFIFGSYILWFISTLFKEDFLVLYLLFFLLLLLFPSQNKVRSIFFLHITLLAFFMLRLVGISQADGMTFIPHKQGSWFDLIQVIFSRELTLFTNLLYPTSAFQQIQTFLTSQNPEIFLLFTRVFLGFYSLIVVYYFWNVASVTARKYLFVFFVVLVFSIVPYLFIPKGLEQESRHYYIAGIFFSLFAGCVLSATLRTTKIYGKLSVYVFLILYLCIHIAPARYILPPTISMSLYRRSFIRQFLSTYKDIPSKTVFIATGDKPFFQSGLGHMLMVLLTENQRQNYADFFPYFLWNINENGYKEIDSTGFGYYYTLEAFYTDELVQQKKFDVVYVFEWNDKTQVLTNKTEEYHIVGI